jgi:hypothetical protein
MKPAKKILAFLAPVILFPILGCMLSVFWFSGGNVFWKPINYFPLPVENVLVMEPFGKEFWVKANDNQIYHIVYPCENGQECWDKVDTVPAVDLSDVSYKVTDASCENDSIRYPLFHKIRNCITSIVPNESFWVVSLVLTEDHQLWIWQNPWDSPYNTLSSMFSSIIAAIILGLFFGVFLVWKIK